MRMPLQVTIAPSVFVQLAGVVTVSFQIAESFPVGATPLTQLAPVSRLLALLALTWSARVDEAKSAIVKKAKIQVGTEVRKVRGQRPRDVHSLTKTSTPFSFRGECNSARALRTFPTERSARRREKHARRSEASSKFCKQAISAGTCALKAMQ